MKLHVLDTYDGREAGLMIDDEGWAWLCNEDGIWSRRKNPALGLLYRSKQHSGELHGHIAGCNSTQVYIGSCSEECNHAYEMIGVLSPAELAELPEAEIYRRGGTAEVYG